MSNLTPGERAVLVAALTSSKNDPLEQTQEVELLVSLGEGVRRIDRTTWAKAYHDDGMFRRAPELSERYPSIPIDFTRRQAC